MNYTIQRSQSLLNQGNIQIILQSKLDIYFAVNVSIPFKSGKYSNCWIKRNEDNLLELSQSLLNQGNIQIAVEMTEDKQFSQWVSIPFKSGKYSNLVSYFYINFFDIGLNPF